MAIKPPNGGKGKLIIYFPFFFLSIKILKMKNQGSRGPGVKGKAWKLNQANPPEGVVFLGRSVDLPVPRRGTLTIARRMAPKREPLEELGKAERIERLNLRILFSH
jgi:hypothetical protein